MLGWILLGLVIYMLPSLLAIAGRHPHWRGLLVANVILGWVIYPWVVILLAATFPE